MPALIVNVLLTLLSKYSVNSPLLDAHFQEKGHFTLQSKADRALK